MAEVELPVDSLAGGTSELKFDSSNIPETYPKENGVLSDENGYVKVTHNPDNPSSSDSESDNSSIMTDNEDMSVLDASTDFDIKENKQVVRDVALDLWAQDTFMPVCVSLLDHCANENVIASAVQEDLKLLASIVQGFCDQHQTSSRASSATARTKTPPAMASSLTRCTKFDFSEDCSPLADEHVSVKVLHSVVESLISPLLAQISQEFTFAMCSEIVEMLRKLILQVEGCLSFLNSSKEVNIYGEIFTEQRKQQLRKVVAATPPPAYKVHSLCRDTKLASSDHRQFVRLSGSHVVSPIQTNVIPASKTPVATTQSLSLSADKASLSLSFHGKTRSMDSGKDIDSDPLYFRPGRMRRTTVSLSHKEVANLFLSKRRSTSVSVETHAMSLELPAADGVKKSYHYSSMLKQRYAPLDDHGEKLRRLHKELLKGFGHHTSSADEEEDDEEEETTEEVKVSKDKLVDQTIEELEEDTVLPSPSTTTESTSTATTIDSSSTPVTDTPSLDVDDSSSKSERNSTFSSSGSRSSGAYDHMEISKASSPENDIARRHNSPPPPISSAPTTPSRKSGIFKKVQRVVSSPYSFEYSAKRSPSRNKSRKSIRPTSTFFDIDLSSDNQIVITVELNKKRSSFKDDTSRTPFDIHVVTNMPQLSQKKFTITRQFREIVQLHDDLISSMFIETGTLPSRPDKKFFKKNLKHEIQDYLQAIISNSELRKQPRIIDFFQPDTGVDSPSHRVDLLTGWEHKFTFFTPEHHDRDRSYGAGHLQVMQPSAQDIELPLPSLEERTKSLGRRRATTIIKQEEEELEPSTMIVQEEGKDVLVVKLDSSTCVIVGGTFDKLVEQLACEEKPDPKYVSTFLFGYRHFASPLEFADKLYKRFELSLAPDATHEELTYVEKWKYMIQLRVVDILTYWVTRCWPDFYRNPPVMKILRSFIQQLKASTDSNFQSTGEQLECIVNENVEGIMKFGSSAELEPDTPDGKLMDLDSISSIQLARHLTVVELAMFRAIDLYEMTVHLWEGNTSGAKPYRSNLDAYIQRFNDIYSWVCLQVLDVNLDCKERANRIEKFIEVTKQCYRLGNFNTLVAIISGLTCAAIRRLQKSWEHVKEKSLSTLKKMYHLPDPSENYGYYRNVVKKRRKKSSTCIPMFAVIMKDFTFLHDGIPKKLRNGLLNFKKLRDIVDKLEELKRYQNSKYTFPVDDRIYYYCRYAVTEAKNEDELFQLSIAIE